MTQVYFADDEPQIRDTVTRFLLNEGFLVTAFETGDDLLRAFAQKPCDLVLLDIMMPGTDGLGVLAQLRANSTVPVILLTAKDSDADLYTGMSLGADDYLAKPFRPLVLLAKIRAILRRAAPTPSAAAQKRDDMAYGNLTYSERSRTFAVAGAPVEVTPTEGRFLAYLMRRPGEAVERGELLREVWDIEYETGTRVADEAARRVRKKLLAAGADVYPQTVWGYGFKLERGSAR
jgi:DNA-binding response OmpR family regulator